MCWNGRSREPVASVVNRHSAAAVAFCDVPPPACAALCVSSQVDPGAGTTSQPQQPQAGGGRDRLLRLSNLPASRSSSESERLRFLVGSLQRLIPSVR